VRGEEDKVRGSDSLTEESGAQSQGKRSFPVFVRTHIRVIALTLGVLSGLGMAEVGARIYNKYYMHGERRTPEGTIHIKNLAFTADINMIDGRFRRTCTVDNPPEVPSYRLAMLGDSFVMGGGVNDCETFSSLISLERPWMDVVNFGRSGEGFKYNLIITDEEVCNQGFDGAVLLIFGNDFLELQDDWPDLVGNYMALAGLILRPLRHTESMQKLNAFLARRGLAAGPPRSIEPLSPYRLPYGEDYVERPFYYPVIWDLVQDRDAYFHMSYPPPELGFPNRDALERVLEHLRPCVKDLWIAVVPNGVSIETRLRHYVLSNLGSVPVSSEVDWVYDTVRSVANNHEIPFIETYQAFLSGTEQYYFTEDPHWTAAGQRLFSELLLDVLPSSP
jgi:hypothetical protein